MIERRWPRDETELPVLRSTDLQVDDSLAKVARKRREIPPKFIGIGATGEDLEGKVSGWEDASSARASNEKVAKTRKKYFTYDRTIDSYL